MEPLIPPARRGGNRRTVNVREVVNGLMYVLSTGCQWRRSPRTCHRARQSTIISICGAGTVGWMVSTTRFTLRCRGAASREASPTAAIIDSQSVKSAEEGGPAFRSAGLPMPARTVEGQKAARPGRYPRAADATMVHAADIQGSRRRRAADGEPIRPAFRSWSSFYARHRYQGPQFQSAMKGILARVNVEIVKRSERAEQGLPKRSIVKHTFAWLGRCRRLAKDWECLNRSAGRACASPPFASCSESSAIPGDLLGQL